MTVADLAVKTRIWWQPESAEALARARKLLHELHKKAKVAFSAMAAGRMTPTPSHLASRVLPGSEGLDNRVASREPVFENYQLPTTTCTTHSPVAQKGDLACLIVGAYQVHLLRREADHYVLVGAASCLGQHDNLWKDIVGSHDAGHIEVDTFELR